MSLYDNVKKACKEKGMSVLSVEESFGWARGTIGKWDDHDPGISRVKAVADKLGITVAQLLDDSDSAT